MDIVLGCKTKVLEVEQPSLAICAISMTMCYTKMVLAVPRAL